MKKLNLNITSATRQNTRDFSKPNEDFLLADKENGIFILLDGITRVHAEYDEIPGYSAASEVNQLFCHAVYEHIKTNLTKRDIRKVITSAIILGNQKITRFREQKSLEMAILPRHSGNHLRTSWQKASLCLCWRLSGNVASWEFKGFLW